MKFNCHLIIHRLSAILLATTIFANLSITSALATTSKNPFQDVSENAPYAEAVQYVYDRGISHGTGATTFSPNNHITYGELSLMLCRMHYPDESWTIESATNYVRDRMGYVVDPMEVQHSRVMTVSYTHLTLPTT